LTEEQARNLLQAAQGEDWGLIVILAVYTGMRAGEIFALHWDDIDFEAGTVRIDSGMVWTKQYGKIENPTKTKTSKRTITLAPLALALLAARKEAQGGQASDYLFVNRVGKPYVSSDIRLRWKGLLKTAGIPDMTLHELRHSFTSFMAHLRVPEKAVQEMLGHAAGSPITREVYTHSLPGVGQEAAKRLSELLHVSE